MTVVPDIPRLYTALAEWSACLLFVLLLKPRHKEWWKRILISVGALAAQTAFLVSTGHVIIYFWIPCMIIAVLIMIGYIYASCKISLTDSAYFAMFAFVLAEFVASLEWQIVCFMWEDETRIAWWIQLIPLIIVYAGVEGVIGKLLSKRIPSDGHLQYLWQRTGQCNRV